MVMLPQKRLPLVLVAGCLVLAATGAEGFVLANLDHAHAGEPCSVCLQVEAARVLLEGLGRVCLCALTFRLVLRVSAVKNRLCSFSAPQTLVALNIKNNS